MKMIGVIFEDGLAPVPAIDDVINRPRILDSQLARHGQTISIRDGLVNTIDRPLCVFTSGVFLIRSRASRKRVLGKTEREVLSDSDDIAKCVSQRLNRYCQEAIHFLIVVWLCSRMNWAT